MAAVAFYNFKLYPVDLSVSDRDSPENVIKSITTKQKFIKNTSNDRMKLSKHWNKKTSSGSESVVYIGF